MENNMWDMYIKELAKGLTVEILGEDYREPEKESFYRRSKKCLAGFWRSFFGSLLGR